MLIGCGPPQRQEADVTVEWTVDQARVGPAAVTVVLRDSSTQPISGADVDLEGTMTHPGMQPSMVELRESRPGTYEGTIELTMAGDWVLLLNATLPNGATVHREHELTGVQAN